MIYSLHTITLKIRFNRFNSGSAQPSLNRNFIYPIKVKVPLPSDQKKIAAVLTAIDAKIELKDPINPSWKRWRKPCTTTGWCSSTFPMRMANLQNRRRQNGLQHKPETGNPGGVGGWILVDWIASDKTGDWGKESEEGNYTLEVNCIRGTDINGLNGRGDIAAPIRFIHKNNKNKLLSAFDFIIEISGGSPTQSTGRMTFILEEVLA